MAYIHKVKNAIFSSFLSKYSYTEAFYLKRHYFIPIMINSKLNSRLKGNIGEDIACKFLMKKGFTIMDRNYLKKWGEIDIVAKKRNIFHFIEVKSVEVKDSNDNVSSNSFRPEENVHVLKQRRLRRVIQTYLLERGQGLDVEFFFHVVVVRMNTETRRAKVSLIENVIL
jgi:putative endonuclease